MTDYKKKVIRDLVGKILEIGFRPFVAERGTHGFYTDLGGTKLVGFQCDDPFDGLSFFGKHQTSKPTLCGTGWRFDKREGDDLRAMFDNPPPQWALKGATSRPTTLVEHLAIFGNSSRYTEAFDACQASAEKEAENGK